MCNIGFSTGSLRHLSLDEVTLLTKRLGLRAIEFSALRLGELGDVLEYLPTICSADFDHVSLHLPSKMSAEDERDISARLTGMNFSSVLYVIHPDAITDFSVWRALGEQVVIENMDARKTIGRTEEELNDVFRNLPNARFCLDIAHARQVDPTMSLFRALAINFRDRLAEVHLSDIDSAGVHYRLSNPTLQLYQEVWKYIKRVPIILESPLSDKEVNDEARLAQELEMSVA